MVKQKSWQYVKPTDFELTHNGKIYRGSYRVEDKMLAVSLSGGGSKKAEIRRMPVQALANLLLLELIGAELEE